MTAGKSWLEEYPWSRYDEQESWFESFIKDFPGWRDITIQFCDSVNKLIEQEPEAGKELTILQLKEKFGGVRVYFGPMECSYRFHSELNSLVNLYEMSSYATCTHCGKDADIVYIGGYAAALCPTCHAEFLSKLDK